MLRQGLSPAAKALRSASCRLAPRHLRPSQYQIAPLALRRTSAAAPARRWYSEVKETLPEEERAPGAQEAAQAQEAAEAEAVQESSQPDPVAELKKALEAKDAELREWKDKCLRSVADFRNLQDRTARDVKAARDFAIQRFAKDLVDSVDNLDRALTTVPTEKLEAAEKSEDLQDLVNLYDGLKMTDKILLQTLSKHGLERVDPNGEKFNPNEHEATFMAPQPDKENNTVFHVQQKGFKLNGRVLRAAKVGVVKNA